MSLFTDDDLKRLKDGIEGSPHYVSLKALLARLEAAEKALKDAEGAIYSVYDPDKSDCPLCDNFLGPCKEYCDFPKFHASLGAWRKTAGK